MHQEDFNAFCNSLWATTHVVQWGESHVWKVGEKVFAIGRWSNREHPGITFKVSEIAFEVLRNELGLRPAPYFASRGMKWIQHFDTPGLSNNELKEYLILSHHEASKNLTKKI